MSLKTALVAAAAALLCRTPAYAVISPGSPADHAPLTVVYRPPSSPDDPRSEYFHALLRLALNETRKADGPFVMRPAGFPISQRRAVALVRQNRLLDVVWTMTTPVTERRLQAIRIPLLRGLLGYRVLVSADAHAASFARIHSLKRLATLTAVQGTGWPDVRILRANGLKVVTAPDYRGLFRMVASGHADYFPRSVAEAGVELRSMGVPGLTIVPGLVLHYVAPIYFFVNRRDTALAQRIREGLQRALSDGSFMRLFRTNPDTQQALAWLRHGHHVVLQLRNPLLPKDTPLSDTNLWYHPSRRTVTLR